MPTMMTSMFIESRPNGDGMMGAPSSRQSTQGKRAACDRCRGQKLRCLREDQNGGSNNGKCIRCNTAGAVCSFSASKRAGRPPAWASSTPVERRGREKSGAGGQTRKQTVCAGRSENDVAEGQQGDNCDQSRSVRTVIDEEGDMDIGHTSLADEFLARPLNDSSMHDSDWEPLADLPWPDEGTTAFYNGRTQSGLESFAYGHNWSLPTTLSTSLESNAIPAHFKTSNDQMSESSSLAVGQGDAHVGAQAGERDEGSINFISTSFTPKTKDFAEVGSGLPSESLTSGDDAQHRRMQELSELGMSLYSQLIANEEYHQAQTSTGSLGLRENFVGNIIKSSATFLNLLTTFYPSSSIKHSTSKVSVFDPTDDDDDVSPSNASILSDFATIAGDRTRPCQWKRSVSRASIVSNIKEDPRPVTADMTTIFQLLTCYIRIIRLHSIFYTQIHDYLTVLPSKCETPPPPIFPGIQVGGVPLDEFRNFQVKLLLQISTHVLGEIEMLLGLPEGYRISKKNPQSQGILETSVSVQFVEMTMRENGRIGLGIEWDRVKSIRDKLGSLRVLLKGTINI
ncbi:hypothetical protein OEA41_009461 [Lepraria neglecta]|uniref:Zn(2)-C6 fungal-type domain-containing protein n=1 Tax=Lepraria neglecta TaxID=209136 RepID=A0AAD9Z364_9LECA|nr:hypothetical protein OEA41_009461 [Lepraria neglecta]